MTRLSTAPGHYWLRGGSSIVAATCSSPVIVAATGGAGIVVAATGGGHIVVAATCSGHVVVAATRGRGGGLTKPQVAQCARARIADLQRRDIDRQLLKAGNALETGASTVCCGRNIHLAEDSVSEILPKENGPFLSAVGTCPNKSVPPATYFNNLLPSSPSVSVIEVSVSVQLPTAVDHLP